MISTDKRQRLRESVRFFYDLQKLRIQQGNRAGSETIMLDDKDREFHKARSKTLNALERAELRNIERLCKTEKIYKWLRDQKGIGPTMCGVLMSEVDIQKAETVSALWKFVGLDVVGTAWVDAEDDERFSVRELEPMPTKTHPDGHEVHFTGDNEVTWFLKYTTNDERYWLSDEGDILKQELQRGHAPRPTKGQKLTYNAWLRTKVVGVAADCMIKLGSPWREYYDNYKHRKQHTLMKKCMGCDGTSKAKKGENKGKKCKNCKGTGKNAPWGESDGHRHRAAIRYMMKKFLAAFWCEWRAAENLEVRAPYAEAVLGRVHGDHGGMGLHQPIA